MIIISLRVVEYPDGEGVFIINSALIIDGLCIALGEITLISDW